MFGTSNTATNPLNPNKDFELPSTPSDGVTCLKFSPLNIGNYIIAGSWDKSVRCWEIQMNRSTTGQAPNILSTQPKAMFNHEAPILCCDWAANGQSIFTGGADNKVKCWNLATQQSMLVAQHNEPVKEVFWIENKQILATASWDKTIKYWDLRAGANCQLSVDLSDKVVAMDVVSPLLVAATIDKQIHIFDLSNPRTPFNKRESPLKYQTRSIACFPDQTGFALGSIEGRVAIETVDPNPSDAKFTFKCHRENETTAYAVNCISFAHPYGTFSTAGSDGVFNFWDKDNRNRLKQFQKCQYPISATCFNADATLFAYSPNYDWSKGYSFYDPSAPNHVLVHPVAPDEIKKNPNKGSKGGRR